MFRQVVTVVDSENLKVVKKFKKKLQELKKLEGMTYYEIKNAHINKIMNNVSGKKEYEH